MALCNKTSKKICKRRTPLTDALLLVFLTATYSIVRGSILVVGIFFIQFQYHLGASAGDASLAIGLSNALNYLGGPLYGILYIHTGYKRCLISASVLTSLGHMLVSVANSIHLVQLLMAMLIGCGVGLTHISVLSVAGQAFTTKRSFANSIISAGTMVAALFLGPMVQSMVEAYSWRWSSLILGAIVLNSIPTTLLADWFYIPDLPATDDIKFTEKDNELSFVRGGSTVTDRAVKITTPIITSSGCDTSENVEVRDEKRCSKIPMEFSLLLDTCFLCYLISMCGAIMAVACPSFYLIRYAQDTGIGDTQAVWLLSISRGLFMTSCPLFGLATSYCGGSYDENEVKELPEEDPMTPVVTHVSPGERCGRFWASIRRSYVLVFLQLFMAFSLAIPLMSESYYGFLAYSILSGISTAPIASLGITVLADLFGPERLPSTLSFRSLAAGIFLLMIPPFIGHLVDVYGNYKPAQYVCCALSVLGAILTFVTQIMLSRRWKYSQKDDKSLNRPTDGCTVG